MLCEARKTLQTTGTCLTRTSRRCSSTRFVFYIVKVVHRERITYPSAQDYIKAIRDKMSELPDATRDRLLSQGLSERDVEVLMDVDSGREVGFDGELGRGAVAYFDEVSRSRDPKAVVNWLDTSFTPGQNCQPADASTLNRITHELLGQLAFRHETFKQNPISAEQMGDLVDLVQSQKVTGMDKTMI